MEELVMDEAFWDNMYQEGRKWSGKPNPQLVAEVSDLKPGTALDVGCGEGADAIWLTERGWQVTGVDISGVAIERAREHSSDVTWLHLDLLKVPVPSKYDLVSSHYVHVYPQEDMHKLLKRLAEAVAPGGTLLVVGHDQSERHEADLERPDHPDIYFTGEKVLAALNPEDWVVEVSETRAITQPDHRRYDFVFKARRR